MRKALSLFATLMAATASAIAAGEVDYTKGVIFVNEDWYGHQNSTLNFLVPDDPDGNFWHYRIIQAENPGVELGCTNQYGAIWNGKLYLIAKQDKDPGATITGGRITVADATTMKVLHQQSLIDPSGAQCDGRGFLGIDKHKGYISTSNGVWIFDLDTFTVKGQVEGTENPNAGGNNDKPNDDPTGSLYHGQCGMMVAAAGKVFVAHQQYGVLIVDPTSDKVIDVISMDIVQPGAGVGSIVKSKDGNLWLSVTKNLQGTGAFLNYIVKLEPQTLKYEIIPIPEGMYPPSNSWYAWTPDAFVASEVQNCLYWKGGPNRWFSGTQIFKYDIDSGELSLFVDLDKEGANWKLYGCSLGVHPITDEIYMSLYHEFGTPTYITRRYSPTGKIIRDYDMIMNYWFPSMPLFPEGKDEGNASIDKISDTGIAMEYASGTFIVCGASGSELEIYNLTGIKLLSQCISNDIEHIYISLAPGIYIAKVKNTTRKIVVR